MQIPLVIDDVLVKSMEIGESTSMEKLEAVTQEQAGTQPQPVPQPQVLTETEKEVHIDVVVHEVQTVLDRQTRNPVDEGEAVRIQHGEGSKQVGEGELQIELPIDKKVPPTPGISKRSLRSNLVHEEDVEMKSPQPKRRKSKEGETEVVNPSTVIRTGKKQKHAADEAKVTQKKRSSKR